MAKNYTEHYANIHRGLYNFSQVTTSLYESVREKVSGFINAPSSKEIVFTRNSTEAINLVAQSYVKNFLKPGDEIILSEMEHHANIVPWQLLSEQTGINIRVVPIKKDCTLDIEAFERLLNLNTKFVSVVHISNATGVRNDVKKITEIAKDFYPEIKVLIDGSQAAVHDIVDVQDLGCDFYTFTGHKLYAPNSTGVLWGKYELLDQMSPYQGGGDMIEEVTFSHTSFKPPPSRFEAGTPAIVDVIGLGQAIDYLDRSSMSRIISHERALYKYLRKAVESIKGITIYGDVENKAGILSITMEWGHPDDVGMILDQCGVAVRTGHHCCMPMLEKLSVSSTLRCSLGMYNNSDDVDSFVKGLSKAKGLLA
jgi:cysteine desulfurase/selenocysteine lyase